MSMNLRTFIRAIPDFPKQGILFRDVSPLIADREARHTTISLMADCWIGRIDVVLGLDARGFIFGSLLADRLGLPFVMARKKGKLPGKTHSVSYDLEYGVDTLEVQEGAFVSGARVLVVDDLLATGGTALAAMRLIAAAGGTTAGLAVVIELPDLGGRDKIDAEQGIEIQSLVVYKEDDESVRYSADAIARDDDEKFVLVERLTEPCGLAFAGGGLHAGEEAKDAVAREFLEETGMTLQVEREFGVFDASDRDPRHPSSSIVFVGRARGTPLRRGDKTRVVLMSELELRASLHRLVFDHSDIAKKYLGIA